MVEITQNLHIFIYNNLFFSVSLLQIPSQLYQQGRALVKSQCLFFHIHNTISTSLHESFGVSFAR